MNTFPRLIYIIEDNAYSQRIHIRRRRQDNKEKTTLEHHTKQRTRIASWNLRRCTKVNAVTSAVRFPMTSKYKWDSAWDNQAYHILDFLWKWFVVNGILSTDVSESWFNFQSKCGIKVRILSESFRNVRYHVKKICHVFEPPWWWRMGGQTVKLTTGFILTRIPISLVWPSYTTLASCM